MFDTQTITAEVVLGITIAANHEANSQAIVKEAKGMVEASLPEALTPSRRSAMRHLHITAVSARATNRVDPIRLQFQYRTENELKAFVYYLKACGYVGPDLVADVRLGDAVCVTRGAKRKPEDLLAQVSESAIKYPDVRYTETRSLNDAISFIQSGILPS